MKLAKKTRKRLHEAQGKPIEITWPADAPILERGGRYPVYGKDGERLFTIRVEGWKGHKCKKALAVIDNDPRRPLIGLKSVRRDDGSTETEPERVDAKYETQLAAEAHQRNTFLRSESSSERKTRERGVQRRLRDAMESLDQEGQVALLAGIERQIREATIKEVPTELPSGYLLPPGKTMADVRKMDAELLASEGIDIDEEVA